MCLTNLLFSSPRLKFSSAQQKAVLSWAQQLGATVPEYTKLCATQEGLLKELGDPTTRQKSGRGNVFYLNEIGNSIAKVSSYIFSPCCLANNCGRICLTQSLGQA